MKKKIKNKKIKQTSSTKSMKKPKKEKNYETKIKGKKEEPIPEVQIKRKIPQTIQESLNQIKEEMKEQQPTTTEIEVKKTPFVLDKVYLQSITFEIASMRQALDRIGQKLDKLEKELAAHRKGE